MTAPDDRVCEGPDCTVSLAGMRPQARFHTPACRAAASRMRRSAGDAAPEPNGAVSSGSSVENLTTGRRVNAPGLGVRVYFASTVQADEVYAALCEAGLIDAASRVTRATARQRVRLQTALELEA